MSSEIESLKSQIQDLVNKVKELEEKNKKEEFKIVERIKIYEPYYCIYNLINNNNNINNNNAINKFNEYFDIGDNIYYNSNNYFHTKEEAEKYLKRFLLELKILRTRDKINDGWKPVFINEAPLNTSICINSKNKVTYKLTDMKLPLLFKDNNMAYEFRQLISDEEIIEFLSF